MLSVEVFDVCQLQKLAAAHCSSFSSSPSSASCPSTNACCADEAALLARFMEALGPGLLAVRASPSLHLLRQALLPLAPSLALLPPSLLSSALKNHGLGTDVPMKDPDRPVSSFAAQLKFGPAHKHKQQSVSEDDMVCESENSAQLPQRKCELSIDNALPHERLLPGEEDLGKLGSLFRTLGAHMVEIGLLVAKICDIAIRGAGLEQAILESCTAKGRLIHYHSLQDKLGLRASTRIQPKKMKKTQGWKHNTYICERDSYKELWQQWHFDYGIVTVLTAPMFLSTLPISHDPTADMDHAESDECLNLSSSMYSRESEPPSGHIELKILNPCNGRVEFVCVPEDCLLVQVGEAAQILTGGKLRATAHCVCRPTGRPDISRETFVVFLQPSWQKVLKSPKAHIQSLLPSNGSDGPEDAMVKTRPEFEEIWREIPALESRWKEGCTFADFARETTKQYYGSNGAQSGKQ